MQDSSDVKYYTPSVHPETKEGEEKWVLLIPGFDPLTGQGKAKGQFFGPSESTFVQSCLCLTSLRVYSMHPTRVHT